MLFSLLIHLSTCISLISSFNIAITIPANDKVNRKGRPLFDYRYNHIYLYINMYIKIIPEGKADVSNNEN